MWELLARFSGTHPWRARFSRSGLGPGNVYLCQGLKVIFIESVWDLRLKGMKIAFFFFFWNTMKGFKTGEGTIRGAWQQRGRWHPGGGVQNQGNKE